MMNSNSGVFGIVVIFLFSLPSTWGATTPTSNISEAQEASEAQKLVSYCEKLSGVDPKILSEAFDGKLVDDEALSLAILCLNSNIKLVIYDWKRLKSLLRQTVGEKRAKYAFEKCTDDRRVESNFLDATARVSVCFPQYLNKTEIYALFENSLKSE